MTNEELIKKLKEYPMDSKIEGKITIEEKETEKESIETVRNAMKSARWINVEEGVPIKGEIVIFFSKQDDRLHVGRLRYKDGKYADMYDIIKEDSFYYVTKWIPCPKGLDQPRPLIARF